MLRGKKALAQALVFLLTWLIICALKNSGSGPYFTSSLGLTVNLFFVFFFFSSEVSFHCKKGNFYQFQPFQNRRRELCFFPRFSKDFLPLFFNTCIFGGKVAMTLFWTDIFLLHASFSWWKTCLTISFCILLGGTLCSQPS